jgi:hypothetical protein
MKSLLYVATAVSLALAGNAFAAPGKGNSSATPPGQETPPGQQKRPADPDQGDDNANAAAALRVSSHDNPSARRSAIVQQPDSP